MARATSVPSWAAGPRRPARPPRHGPRGGQGHRPAPGRRPARSSAGATSWRPTPPTSMRAAPDGADATALDRLRLTERPGRRPWPTGCARWPALADPVGEVVEGWVRPNGLRVERVRVPLGRGRHHLREPAQRHQRRRRACASRRATPPCCGARRQRVRLQRRHRRPACARRSDKAGLPEDAVVLVEDTSREAAVEFMRLEGVIDCLIPRGGPLAHRHRSASTPPCPT